MIREVQNLCVFFLSISSAMKTMNMGKNTDHVGNVCTLFCFAHHFHQQDKKNCIALHVPLLPHLCKHTLSYNHTHDAVKCRMNQFRRRRKNSTTICREMWCWFDALNAPCISHKTSICDKYWRCFFSWGYVLQRVYHTLSISFNLI